MNAEAFVKTVHPNAQVLYRSEVGWAVFFEGRPRCTGVGLWSQADAYSENGTKSSAWVAAKRKIQKEREQSNV